MNGDFLASEEEKETRLCANGEWVGCVLLLLAFAAGFITHWIGGCP